MRWLCCYRKNSHTLHSPQFLSLHCTFKVSFTKAISWDVSSLTSSISHFLIPPLSVPTSEPVLTFAFLTQTPVQAAWNDQTTTRLVVWMTVGKPQGCLWLTFIVTGIPPCLLKSWAGMYMHARSVISSNKAHHHWHGPGYRGVAILYCSWWYWYDF